MVISVKRMNSSFPLVSCSTKLLSIAMAVFLLVVLCILKSKRFHLAILKLVPFLCCLLKKRREGNLLDMTTLRKYLPGVQDGLLLANTELYCSNEGHFFK